MRDKKKEIVVAAETAFWEAVVRACPEAKTGDLGAWEGARFTKACDAVIEAWMRANLGGEQSALLMCQVTVKLRPPRAGERMWWVTEASAADADLALAEVLKNSEELGFVADRDYHWEVDDEGMMPVTVIVLPTPAQESPVESWKKLEDLP